ncbi:MAG: methyl-accepting chemotaxis protein [Nostocaceae cyanobacterium]|nr:methyl-accepting chemotaxis protein [Nostocaceae cyanobacterium]
MPSKPTASKINSNTSPSSGFRTGKGLKLRTKATIFAIAISTVPVLLIGFMATRFASASVKNKISQLQLVATQELADNINRFLGERYRDIQGLASLPGLTNFPQRTTTKANQQAILDQFIEINPVYDSIAVFDSDGDVIVKSPQAQEIEPTDFEQLQQSDRPYISQPVVSKNSKELSIFIVTPVKNAQTNQITAIIQARMPVKSLQAVGQGVASSKREYYLLDKKSQVFLASTQPNQGNKDITQRFPGIDITTNKEDTIVTSNQQHLVSYASIKGQNLPTQWQGQVVMATDTASIFAAQRQLMQTIIIGTALTALIVGVIAAWLAKRTTEPIVKAAKAVKKLGEGELNARLDVGTKDELGSLGTNINWMAQQLQLLVKEQTSDAEWEKSLAEITLRIRKSLKTENIFQTAVKEIQTALNTDRVIIYQFNPENWYGTVVAESVTGDLPTMMGVQIEENPSFWEPYIDSTKDFPVRAIANIYQDPTVENIESQIKAWEPFAVKALASVPIIIQGQLMGLIIAHQCDSSRVWQQEDIYVLQQLATQIGYALEQAKLLEEIEKARQEEQEQKEQLQVQLLALLSDVEGAASGDLRVRAEVTPGEIGTVADFFNSIVENLRLIVTQVKDAANQVNNSLEVNEAAIRDLAQEALDQAGEINNILDAVDQMTNSMKSLATNAREAATVANNASDTAKNSGQAMEMTVQNIMSLRETVGSTAKKVKRLGESTQQISRVVSLINEIAMQTHLLAINAGIEAARAGEEGQGFAVVAEEVSALATRCAGATKEIEHIVENIQRETSDVVQAMQLGVAQVVEGTNIVEDAKDSLNQILEVSRHIDSLVQSISHATASQVQTAQTISQLMQEIAAVSQRTSNSSHQVSASLQKTVEIAQQLQATVGTFQVN